MYNRNPFSVAAELDLAELPGVAVALSDAMHLGNIPGPLPFTDGALGAELADDYHRFAWALDLFVGLTKRDPQTRLVEHYGVFADFLDVWSSGEATSDRAAGD